MRDKRFTRLKLAVLRSAHPIPCKQPGPFCKRPKHTWKPVLTKTRAAMPWMHAMRLSKPEKARCMTPQFHRILPRLAAPSQILGAISIMPTIAPPRAYRIDFRAMLLMLTLLGLSFIAHAQNPNFTLPNLDNHPVRLSDFRGRWVIVNFWATWCMPCLLELPELQAFHEAHHERITVVGVNFEEIAPSEIQALVKRLVITFPIVLSNGDPLPGFTLKGLPTTFLISPDGKLVDTHLGTVSTTMLTTRLAELESAANNPSR